MTLASFFQCLIIEPLKLIFEIIYSIALRTVRNPGLSIIFLSLAINILVLPMYNSADRLQEEQKRIEKKLQPEIDHINKTFKGDERYMMLQTYYRQNHYKPTDQLKGSLSLLLQIPFFIAAYQFLSNLDLLKGFAFGPIRDLGAPDSMFTIGNFQVNVLPILMTVINLVSSLIYTKGSKLKDKAQLIIMALFFLVFLYTSPSGLVFYWTLNNLFSLVKNIILKFKNPGLVLTVMSTMAVPAVIIVVKLFRPLETLKAKVMLAVLCFVLLLPVIVLLLKKSNIIEPSTEKGNKTSDNQLYYLATIMCAVLVGLLIPSSVISSSTLEFVDFNVVKNPVSYVYNSFVVGLGFFLLWSTVFYYLTPKKNRWMFEYLFCALAVIFIIDYMVFGKNASTLTSTLVFEAHPKAAISTIVINGAIILAACVLLYVLIKKGKSLVKVVLMAGICAFAIMSVMNVRTINRDFNSIELTEENNNNHVSKYISLSKSGKNVVVIMLDRAIGPYVPYVFEEKPELVKQFEGFTYYPNSVSFGTSTNFGTPALFGGYEYTPSNINKRSNESLKDKHNEALKMMPYMFNDNGFKVTVMDPPYAGYSNVSDLSIYNERPAIEKYNVLGTFNNAFMNKDKTINRNLFVYSVYKVVPLFAQDLIYDSGNYHNMASPTDIQQIISDNYHARGNSSAFNDSYYELVNMSNITEVQNNSENYCTVMCNNVPHEPNLLQLPDYLPEIKVDNSNYPYTSGQYVIDGIEMKMETTRQIIHYQSNVLTYIKLGEWFDYLRSQGVWDNTRIILVSDHGKDLYQFDNLISDTNEDYLRAMCLLMVKDFDSKEFKTDYSLMTNADVPTLASENLLENPVNPLTGKAINSEEKNKGIEIFFSEDFNVNTNNGNVFNPGPWYSVKDNVLNKDNWNYLGNY